MMPNCEPALKGDPLHSCSGKLVPTPIPEVLVPVAEAHRPHTDNDVVDFCFSRYLKDKEVLKLVKVNLKFQNAYGFRAPFDVAANSIKIPADDPGEGQDVDMEKGEEEEEPEELIIPRRRIKPVIPEGRLLEVEVVDCYRNKGVYWKKVYAGGESEVAIVEILEEDGSDSSGKKRYLLLKHYDPYTVEVCRHHGGLLPPNVTLKPFEMISPLQAETAAYFSAYHLQGSVMPYHLGFYTLGKHIDSNGKLTEYTPDDVHESSIHFGLFAAFELVPGRPLDMFNAIRCSVHDTFNAFGPSGSNSTDAFRRSFRHSLCIADAAYGSLVTLQNAGIGYNNVHGSNMIVYPKYVNTLMRESDGSFNVETYAEYVMVFEGFERSTTLDSRMIKFNRDLKRADQLVGAWEATGVPPY